MNQDIQNEENKAPNAIKTSARAINGALVAVSGGMLTVSGAGGVVHGILTKSGKTAAAGLISTAVGASQVYAGSHAYKSARADGRLRRAQRRATAKMQKPV